MKYIVCLFLIVFLQNSPLRSQTNKIDSLKSILDKNDLSKEEKLALFLKLSALHKLVDTELQYSYAEKALDLAILLYDHESIGNCHLNMGVALRRQAQFSEALEHLITAEQIAIDHDIKSLLASVYVNMGEIYRALDDNLKAIDYCLKSLRINKEINFSRGIAGSSNNLAIIYRQRGEYDKALKYYRDALEVGRTIEDDEIIAMTLHNIGEVLNHQEKYDAALDYYDQSLDLCKEKNINFGIALNLATIGEAMYNLGRNAGAISALRNAIDQFVQMKSTQKEAINRALLAKIYLSNNDQSSAKAEISQGSTLAEQMGAFDIKMMYAKLNAELAEMNRDMDNAIKFMKEYTIHQDSLYSQQKIAEVEKLHILFETEQKETENQLLRQEASIKNSKLMASRYLIVSITLGLILMAGITFFLFKSYLKKRRVNLEIELLNKKLESLLDERTKKIEEQDRKINDFAWYNAHSVRAPLVRILGLVDLIETSEELTTHEIKGILKHIDNSAKELDEVILKLNDLLKDKGIDPMI